MDDIDEATWTEITIQPDGRVYVFGMSAGVLGMLAELWPGDRSFAARAAKSRSVVLDAEDRARQELEQSA